jgi:hypothetical protein
VKNWMNHRADIYQRIPTVDGNNLNTTKRGVRGVLNSLLNKVSFNLAQHINETSEHNLRVERLHLHYKIDKHNIVYLILCSSIRLSRAIDLMPSDPSPWFVVNEPNIHSQADAYDYHMMVMGKPGNMQKEVLCVCCNTKNSRT